MGSSRNIEMGCKKAVCEPVGKSEKWLKKIISEQNDNVYKYKVLYYTYMTIVDVWGITSCETSHCEARG